ncbi:hypothetical protein [Roseiconus lacunae]|uniref:Uncharacterized protein n=1 Tax=Roseiconus lacunae TaxID=2605694 RepID=A0ABT7PGC9_9BACT|nr:hypothetical protein [Roseiconus lacunae]MDM4015271.1 hypothetical protein [Roseiconus lacunae]
MSRPIKCYCGERFIRTPSGWCCPNGHGKLHLASSGDIDPRLIEEFEKVPSVQSIREHLGEAFIAMGITIEKLKALGLPEDTLQSIVDSIGYQADAMEACVGECQMVAYQSAIVASTSHHNQVVKSGGADQ